MSYVLIGLRKYYRAPPYFEAILQTESVIFRPYLGTTGILPQWRLRTDPTNVRRRTWYFRKYYRRFCRTSVIFPMGWYDVFALKPSTSVIPYLFWRRNVLFVTHMNCGSARRRGAKWAIATCSPSCGVKSVSLQICTPGFEPGFVGFKIRGGFLCTNSQPCHPVRLTT